MAHHLPETLMVGEAHVALLAPGSPSAHMTLHYGREAASVLEEYHLPAVLQGITHEVDELGREGPRHEPLAPHLLHIHHLYVGQLHIAEACGEPHQSVASSEGVTIGLQTWGGRSE